MSSIYRKCFVCSVETWKAYFLSPQESSFMSCEILEISDWTNDIQKIKFEQVCYCYECYNRILKIRYMLEELKDLEKEILEEKYKIELKLIESCAESEEVSTINVNGQPQQKPQGMLQILRHEIVAKLGRSSIESNIGKIKKMDVARKYHISRSGILTPNTIGRKKSETHSCNMDSLVSYELPLQNLVVNKPNTLPVIHSDGQRHFSKKKMKKDHLKSKALNKMDNQNLNPTVEVPKEEFPFLKRDFAMKKDKSLQILPINEEQNLRKTANKIIESKKSSKYNTPEENILTKYVKKHGKRVTGENITNGFDITKDISKNLKCGLKQKKTEIKNVVNPSSQKGCLKRKRTSLKFNFPPPPSMRPKKCEECGLVLASRNGWRDHMMYAHGTEARHKCPLCTYGTGHSLHLVEHMTTHSDERNFKCDLCSKTLKTKSSLRCHMRIHGGKFKCNVCLSTFIYEHSLRRHEVDAHGGKKRR